MCSNFEPIKKQQAEWVRKNFDCELPNDQWRGEAYPTTAAPRISSNIKNIN